MTIKAIIEKRIEEIKERNTHFDVSIINIINKEKIKELKWVLWLMNNE